jgi:predicted nucleic acid-binding protein
VTRAILDTGPLVAFLDTRDPRHAWAVETINSFPMPLAT